MGLLLRPVSTLALTSWPLTYFLDINKQLIIHCAGVQEAQGGALGPGQGMTERESELSSEECVEVSPVKEKKGHFRKQKCEQRCGEANSTAGISCLYVLRERSGRVYTQLLWLLISGKSDYEGSCFLICT